KLNHIARRMDSVRRAFTGEAAAQPPGDDTEGAGWLPEFIEARNALKQALLLRDNAPPNEQRRIAAILVRATAEIEGLKGNDMR
ncbi:MAG TPA: PadR family transcriptional regulator, partial [Paraburkholderia sp.]